MEKYKTYLYDMNTAVECYGLLQKKLTTNVYRVLYGKQSINEFSVGPETVEKYNKNYRF